MASPARFARAIMMVRGADGVHKAVEFYNKALGFQVVRHTDEWAELTCGRGVCLHVQAVTNEAQLSVGYSPLLSFDVDDMDTAISTCAQMGAHLDGPIQYPAHGKVAAMRTPDGHMIGLYEPAEL
jgi:catechol 2,3-dioxygenase-like lactoylglutathione lyase family enzyme